MQTVKPNPLTQLQTWSLLGGIWIFIAGSVFHFAFEWSGNWLPLAPFFPVNESVWEHSKLGVWPGFLFAIIEYRFLRPRPANFIAARSLGLISIPFTIIVLFYSYTAILSQNYLVLDILLFIIAISICQLISYRVYLCSTLSAQWNIIAGGCLGILLLALCLLTFTPPEIFLFEHAGTGLYGIMTAK